MHDKHPRRLMCALPLVMVLAGCASLEARWRGDAVPTTCSIDLRTLRADVADLPMLERRFIETGSLDARFRLAWVLARPDAGVAEERQALSLLDGLTDGDAADDGCARALADLLRDQLAARQRLRESLAEERRRREQLAIQLEELKAIERRITDRVRSQTPDPAPTEVTP